MNILLFTYDIPYPLTSGGKIRAYHLMRQLSRNHEITLVTFYRDEEQRNYLGEITKYCHHVELFKRRPVTSLTNSLYLPFFPYPAALYYSPSVKHRLQQLVKDESIDLIHFESFYTSPYLGQHMNITQVVGTENIEWRVYDAYIQKKSLLATSLLRWEIHRIRRFEHNSWRRADHVIAVSAENAKEITNHTSKPCTVIPNGVDLSFFRFRVPQNKKALTISFVGNLGYIQNQDALDWLIDSLWEKIHIMGKKNKMKLTLLIAGKGTEEINNKVKHATIHVAGTVSDIRDIYEQSDILIAPLRIGSGTKFKVLEAAASGVPIVTTSVGIEGIAGMDNGTEVVIGNDEATIVSCVEELITSYAKRVELAKRAYDVVKQNYSWEAIGSKLRNTYEAIIDHHR